MCFAPNGSSPCGTLSIIDASIGLTQCCRASKLVCRILTPEVAGGPRLRHGTLTERKRFDRIRDWSPKSSGTYHHPYAGSQLLHIALAMRNNQDTLRTQHNVVLCNRGPSPRSLASMQHRHPQSSWTVIIDARCTGTYTSMNSFIGP